MFTVDGKKVGVFTFAIHSSDMPMVEYTSDTLPELTEEQRKELARLDALPADQIDTSDIPELTDEQWASAVRGRFYRPIKQQNTARLDADVLAG